MKNARELHQHAMLISSEADKQLQAGKVEKYLELGKQAFELEREAAMMLFSELGAEPTRSVLYRSAATLALNCNQPKEAKKLIHAALSGSPPEAIEHELIELDTQVEAVLVEQGQISHQQLAYLTLLRGKALNFRIKPRTPHHSLAIVMDHVTSYLKTVKSALISYVDVSFRKTFSPSSLGQRYELVLERIKQDANPLLVNLNWKSFGASISTDLVIMSEDFSQPINDWKRVVFEDFRSEVFFLDYDSMESIEKLCDKYEPVELRAIYGNIIQSFSSAKQYVVSLTDERFNETFREYKPVMKAVRDKIAPYVEDILDEPLKLVKTTGLSRPESEGAISKKFIIETEELVNGVFSRIIKDIHIGSQSIYLKEPLQLEVVYESGTFQITVAPLNLVISGKTFDQVVDSFKKAFAEKYFRLIGSEDDTLTTDERTAKQYYRDLVFSTTKK